MSEWTIEALIGTDVHNLTDGTLCVFENYSGLGRAPSQYQSEQGPQQHGETYTGLRLQPRVFQLIFGIYGSTPTDREVKTASLMSILSPENEEIKLRWTLLDGITQHQIDCVVVGDADCASQDKQGGVYQRVGIRFRAPDPTFYGPVQSLMAFGLSASGLGEYDIPLLIPWFIGASTLSEERTIAYPGTFRSYPIVRIIGPITDAKLVNNRTGDELFLSGVTIGAGHWYEIDCRYGYKTVVDDVGANKIADLTDASDMATFCLLPGDNSLTVSGSGATGATQVYLRYYERFISVWG